MPISIYVVDAFTNQVFKGNPAAVCVLSSPKDEVWMQNVAAEMNLSETAFLHPQQDGYSLRWFTPSTEVDLCGHATLASAHILWELGYANSEQPITFYTKSGLLTASKDGEWIELNFPAEPPEQVAAYPNELMEGLGIQPLFVGRNRFDYLIEIESERVLRELKPNFSLLQQIDTRGIIVTSKSTTNEFDFISRCFFPAVGVDEDPVTGSAHCCLGPYWENKLDKNEFIAYQASKRGGVLKVKLHSNRVVLSGQAVTVLECELVG
ncbi:PhzF family phenazine biosynthesis protein [Thermaerobacillus caldiproteolyticus]|uniref:PhzF family phenazine biosynthesis protein n=1 Tax=Thermaerobacillus caldiproteolyticus TaxID=247480 RepID=UPI00188A5529|nr:PhzF family phenazine biosynthesis protein [Anoxybacillus caldiproteolyticus]QPA31326.1 PhzF family phenazine biosynthesis protein [Anoxybacillus caldiproteolyticus]